MQAMSHETHGWCFCGRAHCAGGESCAGSCNAAWKVGETWWLEGVEHRVVEDTRGNAVAYTSDEYAARIVALHNSSLEAQSQEAKEQGDE